MSITLEISERDMENLILNSLEIRNFRCFKHLQIERLGRVNLIVGKNNVGKSTLLEALQFTIKNGNVSKTYPLRPGPLSGESKIASIIIGPSGLDDELIGTLWDGIALTELEKDIVDAMRIIAPGIEHLSVVGSFDSKERSTRSISSKERAPIPIVKIAGAGPDEQITLRSLGDGMQRVFGLALALVNAKDGILLVDEIENGLHYSVQLDIWQLVFQLAHRLNVQVFATTHSRDCIEAFQQAARENTQEEGLLVRLQNKAGEISAVLYEEDELAIATREQIEVR